MRVLVDTSVWSLALRRKAARDDLPARELTALIDEGRVMMLGAIRQELLSGIRAVDQFKKLRDALRAFPDEALSAEDFENAARCFNTCRAKGVQGSNTDFLLCAVALRTKASILTIDNNFDAYAKHLDIERHALRQ